METVNLGWDTKVTYLAPHTGRLSVGSDDPLFACQKEGLVIQPNPSLDTEALCDHLGLERRGKQRGWISPPLLGNCDPRSGTAIGQASGGYSDCDRTLLNDLELPCLMHARVAPS